MIVAPGTTSLSIDVFFADDAGRALTGKVAADFPACKWSSGTNTSDTTIALSDLAAITTSHPNNNTAGGVKEREGGWYRLDLPNNMLTAAGVKRLTFAETTNKRILSPAIEAASWITLFGGAGVRSVTITVNDGAAVLENARVRVTQGAESYAITTNVSGVAVFALDDATWSVAITKPGYTFTPTTIVVNGTETATYSMTAVSITPPTNPDLSAIEVLCLDSAGQPESGVAVDIRIITVPSGSQNIAFKGTKQTATSDGDGIARFEVVQGSVCEWKRGIAEVWQQVAIDADSVTNVTSVIGSP